MIGNLIGMGRAFQGVVAYNLRGHKGQNLDKCAWHQLRNLPGEDPELAATMMEATARQSRRVETPVLHFSIDWHPDEKPTDSQAKRAAAAVLERLGLTDHQAAIFRHQDAAHPHIHLVVNRVHPETGKAWAHWKSKEKLELAIRETAKELGFLRIPGRDRDKPRTKEKRGEYRRKERKGKVTDGPLTSTPRERVETLLAAQQDYPAADFSRFAKTYRNQRAKTKSIEKKLNSLKATRSELMAERRSSLWSGVWATLTLKSPKKADREAARFKKRIDGLERVIASTQARLNLANERLSDKRNHLDGIRSKLGSRENREQKRNAVTQAAQRISQRDLSLVKMPRRERQRLSALVKTARSNTMTHRSSFAIMVDRVKIGEHLARENKKLNTIETEREKWKSDEIVIGRKLKQARDALEAGEKNAAAIIENCAELAIDLSGIKRLSDLIERLENERTHANNMFHQAQGRFIEVNSSVNRINEELAGLERQWYDANEREKNEKKLQKEQEHAR